MVPAMPKYHSIAAQVGAPAMPAPDNMDVEPRLAANQAMHDLLVSLFAYPGTNNTEAKAWCDDLYHSQRDRLMAGISEQKAHRSEAYGAAMAQAVYAWSATDPIGHLGQWHNTDPDFVYPVVPGAWVPTPPSYLPPVQPHWGDARVFVAGNNSGACVPDLPIAFDPTVGSPFYQQAYEVYQTSINLTSEQQTIALYWSDGTGTITPPGHMINLATQALEQNHASMELAAETYCRVGMAVNDAFVSCWKGKYQHFLQRPITYIHAQIDPGWTPLIATPAFPTFGSGHATQSGAAAQVLSDLFGYEYAFTDHTNDAQGFAPRNFDSFFEAAEEASISRLYGGIHYRMDNESGYEAGKHVGQRVSQLAFRK
jgi:hypothetical protein